MRKIICIFLCMLTVGAYAVTASASSISNCKSTDGDNLSEWYDSEGNLDYPLNNYRDKYENLPAKEKKDLCQIPDELLENLSTEELLELVLKHPFIGDIYGYDSITAGLVHFSLNFNGCMKLLHRDDCGRVVAEYYSEYEIPRTMDLGQEVLHANISVICNNEELWDRALNDAKVITTVVFCESILAQNSIYNKLSDTEKNIVIDAIESKVDVRSTSLFFEQIPFSFFSQIESEATCARWMENQRMTELSNEASTLRSSSDEYDIIYTTTRGGKRVTLKKYKTVHVISSTVAAQMVDHYRPYASIVSLASDAFNCHAFAWLSDTSRYGNYSTTTTLDTNTPFLSDSTYVRVNINNLNVDDYVDYGAHSAIVSNPTLVAINASTSPQPKVYSKWGNGGPIVCHYVTECKYYQNAGQVSYYR
ncbi:MAG: hypothetical protein ACI4EW_06920 [Butyrivibrio sp.]